MLAISKRGINSWRSTHGKVRDSSWHPLQSPISFTRFSLQGPTFSTKSLVARTARPSPRRPRFPQMPGHTRLRATMQRGRTFSHHRLESKAFGTLLDLCVSSRHLCCRHRQGSKWVTKCYTPPLDCTVKCYPTFHPTFGRILWLPTFRVAALYEFPHSVC